MTNLLFNEFMPLGYVHITYLRQTHAALRHALSLHMMNMDFAEVRVSHKDTYVVGRQNSNSPAR